MVNMEILFDFRLGKPLQLVVLLWGVQCTGAVHPAGPTMHPSLSTVEWFCASSKTCCFSSLKFWYAYL